jgi:hypothetical protein
MSLSWRRRVMVAASLMLLAAFVAVRPIYAEDAVPPVTTALEVSGRLSTAETLHVYSLRPNVRDGQVSLALLTLQDDLDPQQIDALKLWLVDRRGLLEWQSGGSLDDVAIAVGLPVAGQERLRQLSFKAVGRQPYTAILHNRGVTSFSYQLAVEGGVFEIADDQTARTAEQTTKEPIRRLRDRVVGSRSKAYFTVLPNRRNGTVTARLIYNRESPNLLANVELFLLNQTQWQEFLSGAGPETANLAAGQPADDAPANGETVEEVIKIKLNSDDPLMLVVANYTSEALTFTVRVSGASFINYE